MQPRLGPNSLLLAQTSAQPKIRELRALVYDAWGRLISRMRGG
jgi:YD repeat-containing protein